MELWWNAWSSGRGSKRIIRAGGAVIWARCAFGRLFDIGGGIVVRPEKIGFQAVF
jgi:hypothetical protein